MVCARRGSNLGVSIFIPCSVGSTLCLIKETSGSLPTSFWPKKQLFFRSYRKSILCVFVNLRRTFDYLFPPKASLSTQTLVSNSHAAYVEEMISPISDLLSNLNFPCLHFLYLEYTDEPANLNHE